MSELVLYHNAKVITMSESLGIVESFVVQNGKIIDLGKKQEVKQNKEQKIYLQNIQISQLNKRLLFLK